jgi:signal transduction histidine kinase
MSRFVLLSLLSALLGIVVPAAHGQELRVIQQVKALQPDQAVRPPRAVKLRGVVTEVGVEKKSFTINDGTEGIGVGLSSGVACPALGDDVEVEGKTMLFIVTGFSHPRVLADAVRVVGKGKLPEPIKLTLAELNSFKNFERWVSVEGFVLRWKFRPATNEVIGCIAGGTTWTTFTVRADGRPDWLTRLMRAKVRVTGINAGVNTHNAFGALIVPSTAQFEILTPGSSSVFDAPLVSIKEVNEGTFDPGTRVKVRGVVASQYGAQVILRGEGGAQRNVLQSPWERETNSSDELADTGPWPVLKPGDEIEFVGSASIPPYPLNFGDVRVIGRASMAPPEKSDVESMKAGRYVDNWITLDARVYAWGSWRDSAWGSLMRYSVWGEHDNTTIHVPTPASVPFPKNLHGAKVRFTGIAVHSAGATSYYIPDSSYFEVLEPGTADPFAVPEHSVADIAAGRVPIGAPTKFKGHVIGVSDLAVYLRTADSALCVRQQPPWNKSANSTDSYADYGPLPALKPGDDVEVMGWAIRSKPDDRIALYDLVGCAARVLKSGTERPLPVSTTFTRIVEGEHTSDLVEVRGRLLTWQVAPLGGGKWSTTMLLKGDGTKLTFVHESAVLHPFDTLKPTDDVLLQAVVDRATEQTPRRLRLLSPSDAKSLGLSAEIINNRFWLYGGAGLALLALFSGWIVALRKSVRSKTEIATLLEQRVDERTSELRQAQADLSKALEQERELGELKTRFVSTVSHEFRTPLGVTMSAVEIMRHFDAKLTPERRQELCNEIHDATRGMAELMEQVLMLGRVEAGKLGYKPTAMDVEILTGKLIDESLSATNRKCSIRFDHTPGLEGAMGDEALIRHILGNLITNAVKYSPKGSEVLVRARRDDDHAVFEIEDHGIGIPEADRVHLFEAFHRCGNVGDIPGTGLGLVIVKRCVDLHGGSIDLRSEVGIGTTFILRLPLFADSSPLSHSP